MWFSWVWFMTGLGRRGLLDDLEVLFQPGDSVTLLVLCRICDLIFLLYVEECLFRLPLITSDVASSICILTVSFVAAAVAFYSCFSCVAYCHIRSVCLILRKNKWRTMHDFRFFFLSLGFLLGSLKLMKWSNWKCSYPEICCLSLFKPC